MKYIVILGDGMSDYPIPQLQGKTPLQFARKPYIDYLAKYGKTGMVKTIPDGIAPGSDAANLSVMGYNPKEHYAGRSPLEAVSMGIKLENTDVTYRCNLVTLSDEEIYENKTMIDYSSDEISSAEAKEIILDIDEHLKTEMVSFYPGISYRHCMVWKEGSTDSRLTPPHDILERKISSYLPLGDYSSEIFNMMKKSSTILKDHPVNIARIQRGLRPANSIWIWGQGRKPVLPQFFSKYGLKGSVISAVDLIKGIGICAGLKSINVEGATGNIHTNFIGKAEAALKEFESGQDFVYLHVEAPDECGHRYEIENKVKAIELLDEYVVGVILKGLEKYDNYKMLILPDHPTPLSLRTHTAEPVPFAVYEKQLGKLTAIEGYDEFQAASTGLYIDEGYRLMDYFTGSVSGL